MVNHSLQKASGIDNAFAWELLRPSITLEKKLLLVLLHISICSIWSELRCWSQALNLSFLDRERFMHSLVSMLQ